MLMQRWEHVAAKVSQYFPSTKFEKKVCKSILCMIY